MCEYVTWPMEARRRGSNAHRAGVTGDPALPDVRARNQIMVLEEQEALLTTMTHPQPRKLSF